MLLRELSVPITSTKEKQPLKNLFVGITTETSYVQGKRNIGFDKLG